MVFLKPILALKEVFEDDCQFLTAFAEETLAKEESTLYIGPSVVEIGDVFLSSERARL